MLKLDHLAVSAGSLAQGVAAVEATLGVAMAAGGEHPLMGTHNRLLGLGDLYLEVISINPDAVAPSHSRWFDLDRFTGAPRLTNWICRTGDLTAAVEAAPPGAGTPVALTRGDLSWSMAVPRNGRLPFDGAFPALIQWNGDAHPAGRLPDSGCRLVALEIGHPEAEMLTQALGGFADPRIRIVLAPTRTFRAEIATPGGLRVLQ